MKRAIAILLSIAILSTTACGVQDKSNSEGVSEPNAEIESEYQGEEYTSGGAISENSRKPVDLSETPNADNPLENISFENSAEVNTDNYDEAQQVEDKAIADENLDLDSERLLGYLEDRIYLEAINDLPDGYYVQNVEAVYYSKEYVEQLEYNSQKNIYFGYTQDELDQTFQGRKYVFTLGDNGETVVQEVEYYTDASSKQIIKNVAIGSGVILVCVTVSVLTSGTAPAVSMIFAVGAKTGTAMALSGGAIGGISAGIVKGYQTGSFDDALNAAAVGASEGYKWGAITGAVAGGASEGIGLYGAAQNGLTMNEAAMIQRESKYPLDVIREFRSMDQYKICKEAGLKAKMVDGKTALVRNIDITKADEMGRTNLQRMRSGLAPLDPEGVPYELHHVGQMQDSTLAVLTKAEHRLGDNHSIWHVFKNSKIVERDITRKAFWKAMAKLYGGI